TKAFNAIQMTQLESDGLPVGSPNRRALPLAGDNVQGKQIASELYETFGFDAVDVGALAEGWRFERGTPAYCVRMTKEMLLAALAPISGLGGQNEDHQLALMIFIKSKSGWFQACTLQC
ncbi:NADPH-dependent F420 reductase, partial [Candidatus Symbiopectobacterium sp. NZEC135]|uniref:NADPH-dependent F420 reductase n=1 Tax=Candidatus Symbiopectobacterium sp. NZEC135 TaxID=2820471 RepID=UPI0039B3BA5A